MADTHAGHHDDHPQVGHVVPVWILTAVWITLMVLTLLTVVLAQLNFGPFDLLIAMGIATVKATLVCLFFMHLYWDKPINSAFFLASFAFVFLFVSMAIADTGQYKDAVEARQVDVPVVLHPDEAPAP